MSNDEKRNNKFALKNYRAAHDAVVLGVIAIVVGVIAIVAAIWIGKISIDTSWRIAEVTGSLAKSDIEVGINGKPLLKDKKNFIIMGTPEVTHGKSPVFASIPFTFKSIGKKSIDTLTITFHYPQLLRPKIVEVFSSEGKAFGDYTSTELRRSFAVLNDQSFVSYRLPLLNPQTGVAIVEPFLIQGTQIKDKMILKFKDNKKGTINYELQFTFDFNVTIDSKDSEMSVIPLSVGMIKAKSFEEIIASKFLSKVMENAQEDLRKKFTFLQYLFSLVLSQQSLNSKIFVIFSPVNLTTDGDFKFYFEKESSIIGDAEYPLLNWKLLFAKTE
jgi:hypothetical protein